MKATITPLPTAPAPMVDARAVQDKNPLKRWRLRQIVGGHVMSIEEAATRAGVTYHVWYSWERWPSKDGRMPGPDNLIMIERVTGGHVTANDFIQALRDKAA